MLIEQSCWSKLEGWVMTKSFNLKEKANFVIVFGAIDEIAKEVHFNEIKKNYPNANILMCSTAGEIIEDRVEEETIVVTAIYYEKTTLNFVEIKVDDFKDSYECGKEISKQLDFNNLKHVLVISDGIKVNGDELVNALNKNFPDDVLITGGLAADYGRFTETYVGLNNVPTSGTIVAVGHYGDDILISHGSKGGWDEFGPTRTVTKSKKNVLYELDGHNALDLYKKYLGEKATELPGSALLFPLCIYGENDETIVRTILSIDEEKGSMTFAGDIPKNATVRFMMANFDRLVDGAYEAAKETLIKINNSNPSLVLMISCVGRKIVLGQRIDEEVESVREIFGEEVIYAGFYSNGEISPVQDSVKCSLHNQTMTITTYSEN